MSDIKTRYYAGFTLILIALMAYIALAVQYSEVNAETFHNEIEEVISRYPVEILHDGDDSEEGSVSHPLNKVRLQNDAAMGNDASMRIDAILQYTNVQNHTYVLTDMAAGVGYYGYEYKTRKQALMALEEVDAAFVARGAQPIEVNGVAAYEAMNPDDTDNVTYWQLTVHENSLYMLMVDGYINGLGDAPSIQEVFQDILSRMN